MSRAPAALQSKRVSERWHQYAAGRSENASTMTHRACGWAGGRLCVHASSGIVSVWQERIVMNMDKLSVFFFCFFQCCCTQVNTAGVNTESRYGCGAWGCSLSPSVTLSLSPGCSSQRYGEAEDLKRLYALDDFSAITSWAEAINPPHMFHLRPKKQNKLICPKLRGPHFISPTHGEEVGNSSSNVALLPSLFPISGCHLKS